MLDSLGFSYSHCYGRNTSPQHLYAKNLMPNVIVLVGGSIGRQLDEEGGILMNGISDLVKKAQRGLRPVVT